MSLTRKLKMFDEYKAFASFKFANQDSAIRKTSRTFLMHYVKTTFDFLGNPFKEKRKYLLLVIFASKDPSLFHKSSKRGNPLKPENLETLVLLSALKVLIKSVTSYQAQIKHLEEA